MSTNALVARIAGDGFVGRTTYWDGDPQVMGHRLFELAQRFESEGGLEAMLEVLIDTHKGWSVINGAMSQAYLDEHKMGLPEASELVEGIGIAYTDFVEEELVLGEEGKALGVGSIEWVYAFEVEQERVYLYEVQKDIPALVGWAPLRGVEPNWGEMECGAHLERCRHAVYVHAERFGIDGNHASARLSVKQFLGIEELREHDAIGAIYKGQRYRLTGNGRREADGHFYHEAWIKDKEGEAKGRIDLQAAGVKLIYPKVREELLRSGEIKVWPWDERTETEVVL